MNNALGIEIQEIRRAQKLSIGELAKRSGVAPSAIQAFEHGRRKPSQHVLACIGEVLCVDFASYMAELAGFPDGQRRDGIDTGENSVRLRTVDLVMNLDPAMLGSVYLLLVSYSSLN